MIDPEEKERLDEIVQTMAELLSEFDQIVRQSDDKMALERFKAYPKGHISMALNNEHEYLGKNAFTLQDIADSLEVRGEETDEDEDDEDTE